MYAVLLRGDIMAYQSKFKSEANDELFKAILSLETEEECYRFFEDLTTIKELNDMALRWQVARLLHENKTYTEIAAITNASTATISRVNKCLVYGADGYNKLLNK
jgi:TrpR-related protein YerC/YecD